MIPKRLICGNFGNMKLRPEVELMCMKSWEEAFPKSEWEWVELNEKTFDVNSHPYAKLAYKKKLFSFVNDYARTKFLYEHGGVYVDTDQLMLKQLDPHMLQESMIIGSCMHKDIDGSTKDITSWGLVGAEPGNVFIGELLKSFDIDNDYKMTKGRLLVMSETRKLLLHLEHVDEKVFLDLDCPVRYDHVTMYPFDFFTAMFWNSDKTFITDRTYGIQLYGSSWQTKSIKSKAFDRITKFLGD